MECYDHVAEEWCHAAAMNVNRSAHKVTVFKVFIVRIFNVSLDLIFLSRMEFDKTRWSCSWNSDQNCTQNSAGGGRGPGAAVGGGRGMGGLFDMKLTLSV